MKNNLVLGICDRRIKDSNRENYSFEINELINEGEKLFSEVITIRPQDVYYNFIRGNSKIIIKYNNLDISNITHLIVRGTQGIENEIATLAKSLACNGAYVFDYNYRFNGAKPGKLLTTIERHKKKVGSSSYLCFTKDQAIKLITGLSHSDFPLITKPIGGSRGRGVKVVLNEKEALEHVNAFYRKVKKSTLLFQKFISIQDEFRVFIIGGKSMGVVKKIAAKNKITANAAQGGIFIAVDDREVETYALKNNYSEAILGVDVARTEDNQLHIIEANFSPQWKSFESATNINIAKKIIEYGLR